MKGFIKIFALILALVLSVGFISCSEDPEVTTDNELSSVADEKEPEETEKINEALNPAGYLPANSTYYANEDGATLSASEDNEIEFPAVSVSDVFVYGDYKYTYNDGVMLGTEGWIAEVVDMKKSSGLLYAVLESINGKPVVKLSFKDCAALTQSPEIPETVVDLTDAFNGCSALTTSPTIPASVKKMDRAFEGCFELKGEVVINATPESYADCFKNTGYTLTITGDCENKADLAATAPEGRITY